MPSKPVVIEKENFRIVFNHESAGFPSSMALPAKKGWDEYVQSRQPWLSIILPSGEKLLPLWPDNYEPVHSLIEDAQRLEFRNLPWQDSDGNIIEDFRCCLRYEFWPDGTTFVNTFFMVENTAHPSLKHFTFSVPMDFPEQDNILWSYWERPGSSGEGLIQALKGIHRHLGAGTDTLIDNMVVPLVSFDMVSAGRRARHIEWFLEGFNSLKNDLNNTSTSITWQDNKPTLTWEFLKEERSNNGFLPWQWRNQWGWVLCQAPQQRKHAPLRMYHYFDTHQRYPTPQQVEKMYMEGADILILHENWRSDPQNGGCPYDEKRFTQTIARAHEYGLRMAVYIRGNEISAYEESCDWFSEFLEKDFDGLYLDYGSAICLQHTDENHSGGHIPFRDYYIMMRNLRKRVGEKGILLSHSGPFFSACGMAGLVDGYVAGEGERGIMLADRDTHAYYSSLGVAPSTLWTAAFPEYASRRAVPLLASVAQFPHVTLGIQFPGSPLAHPQEPGNVTFMRSLWKLWGLFRGETDLTILDDFNSEGIFVYDSPDTGACIIQAQDRALLIIACNFSEQSRWTRVKINWKQSGLEFPDKNKVAFKLESENMKPMVNPYSNISCFESESLCGYGVVAWLICPDNDKWRERLELFKTPYPGMDRKGKEYLAQIEELRSKRFAPRPMTRVFMQLTVPVVPVPYEESLVWDTYESWHELYEVVQNNEHKFLCYLSMKGPVEKKPTREDLIWPGRKTPWIPLHELLGKGEHQLVIKTKHKGEGFYSFIAVRITSNPETCGDAYEFAFANEVDKDRSALNFNVRVI